MSTHSGNKVIMSGLQMAATAPWGHTWQERQQLSGLSIFLAASDGREITVPDAKGSNGSFGVIRCFQPKHKKNKKTRLFINGRPSCDFVFELQPSDLWASRTESAAGILVIRCVSTTLWGIWRGATLLCRAWDMLRCLFSATLYSDLPQIWN